MSLFGTTAASSTGTGRARRDACPRTRVHCIPRSDHSAVPTRGNGLAHQYSPVNMPTKMKEPTSARRVNTTRAAVSQTRSSVVTAAAYVAVAGVTAGLYISHFGHARFDSSAATKPRAEGQQFRVVLLDLGLTSHQVWGLTRTDDSWRVALDAALTATRRDDLEHGTNAAYVAGCVCRACREHQRAAWAGVNFARRRSGVSRRGLDGYISLKPSPRRGTRSRTLHLMGLRSQEPVNEDTRAARDKVRRHWRRSSNWKAIPNDWDRQ